MEVTEQRRRTDSALILTDADTGDELLWFIRAKKQYLYLRDAKTKRFIKRLDAMEVRMYMVVDYSLEEAVKGNPLYLDAVAITKATPEDIGEMVDFDETIVSKKPRLPRHRRIRKIMRYEVAIYLDFIENGLKESLADVVAEFFGYAVADLLLEVRLEPAGIEYGSEVTVKEAYADGFCHYTLVWKHHPEDKPRSAQGSAPI